ncbi:polysaccharide pyruvyl transferase family protein [Pseudomonas sp. GCM10022188]|uniref:polysaccharide pyruvyl transferase family protein n=1 Tax=Pseudomonas TaxID=286 RepID=UPI001E562276|nr:polysaccharide pyruvyl transferase family protein [Pseudomonas oryzagri]MCC6075171.1 polysaccharide pyruvyl transferase family protein [Pseudomonas oryzagri]
MFPAIGGGGSTGKTTPGAAPTLLFGAFDRHNFGDLLFPHIAAALLPGRELRFAGLAERDLRPWGGHRVEALSELAREFAGQPVDILHVGGELLTCDAWEAAVMLLPADEVQTTVAQLDRQPQGWLAWAQGVLGIPDRAPYVVGRELFPQARLLFTAVGGMDLDERDAALRAEVVGKLRLASKLSVRDRQTQALLQAAGIGARLVPDPAVLVKELFGARIGRRAAQGEIAEVRRAFPHGYLAVQFSTDFADDATLAEIAAQLDRVAQAHGLGVALFRAGAAPWHDELDSYRRTAARLHAPTRVVESLNLWDICALVAASQGFLGSSLHGRIVAMAYALPRLSLQRSGPGKAAAYAASWEAAGLPGSVTVGEISTGLDAAFAARPTQLRALAEELAGRYRAGFAPLRALLAPGG